MRRIGAWLLLLIFLGGCTALPQAFHAEEATPLRASGVIQAEEFHLASETGGRIQEVRVHSGEAVKAGEVLVVLDATPLRLQLGPAEAAILVAEAELAQVEAGARAEEIAAARASLQLAEAQRDGAYEAWQNALALVEQPLELEQQLIQARMQAEMAAQQVEVKEADLERVQYLYDRQQASEWELRMAQAALEAAQADRRAAETTVAHLEGILAQPLGYLAQAHAAEGEYRLACIQVKIAQAKLDDLLAGPTAEEIALAEAKVAQAEAEAEQLRIQIARSELRTPIDGVVLEQALRVGELAAPAATILTLADLSKLSVRVYVPENRLGDLYLGQRVEIRVDSYPDETFEGRVSFINSEPEYTPRDITTEDERVNTFYAVKVRVENRAGRLKPGMPADVTFLP